jgi:hypothetical protein
MAPPAGAWRRANRGEEFRTLDGIERIREFNIFLEHLGIIAGFVLVAILGVVGARGRA